jgi:F-type H+-transporting ATPase subunit b
MEIISNIALISINETAIVQVIGFLIFLFVINRIMFRPLRNVMSDRDIHIERIKRDIVQAQKEVESFAGQIQEQETAAKKEAFELKDDIEAAGSQQAKEIFESVKKEITANSQKVQQEIADRIAEEKQALETESEALALSIVEKILDRRQQP